jgi:ankyrin repeat protein
MEKLKARLDAGDDIESRDKGTGRTALLEAVIAGHRDAVTLLVEKGAEIGVSCKAVGMDCLGWAVEMGHGELVDDLLVLGMRPNCVPPSSFMGATPLMIAARQGFTDIATSGLLTRGQFPALWTAQAEAPCRWRKKGSIPNLLLS